MLQAGEDLSERSLIGLLRRVDRSFERGRQTFRASNRDGFLVDLVAALVTGHMAHLPFRPEDLRSFPRVVVEAAEPLFAGERAAEARFDG